MAWNKYPYTDNHELNLDWFLDQFKQLLAAWSDLQAAWTAYKTDLTGQWEAVEAAWQTYKTYIDEYFNNLNVQTEINNKISDMVASGEFLNVISPTVILQTTAETSRWLAEHIAQETGYVLDTSLTVAGAAADAKAAGDAIYDLKEILNLNISDRLTDIDGIVNPDMEIGYIAFASGTITYQNSNTSIRTPSNASIDVRKGDIVGLSDYENAQFKTALLIGENSYSYTQYMTEDYTLPYDGKLYIVVAYQDNRQITSVNKLSGLIRIYSNSGEIKELKNLINVNSLFRIILTDEKLPSEYFAAGTYSQGVFVPTLRPYRVSTIKSLIFPYVIYMDPKAGFRIYTDVYNSDSGTWTGGWHTQKVTIPANTTFGFVIARIVDDTSETPDVDTFVSNVLVYNDLTNPIKSFDIDETEIESFMERFYNSDQAEAYAFFTDPHLMGSNGTFSENTFNQYIDCLAKTVKRTSAAYVVCGGDWLNNGDTKNEASVKLGYVNGRMTSIFPDKYFPMVGNHDYNYLGVDSGGARLPESDWLTKQALHNFWFSEYPNSTYYKFKKALAMNYVLNTEMDYDSANAETLATIEWFASQLITDNPSHATVMFHIFYLTSVGTTKPQKVLTIGKIIQAFNAHTSVTLTSADLEAITDPITFDFTGTTGHIDYCIVGHSHADFNDTLGGVPVIGCVNFQSGGVPSFDLVFADYKNNKVYTTRIGSGTSREFTI